jgi:pimeloyl-ACP methyl ester carboxylesterase
MRTWGPGFLSEAAPADRVEELLGIVADFHPDALASLARSFAESDLRPMLSSIRVPTLLLYGDADVRAPLDVGRALEAAIAGSQLVVLPGVGHVSNIEAPEAFDTAVRRFLRSVPA